MAPGASVVRAARQGDFDGLCGLYALINALDLAGFKRSRSTIHQRMFMALTDALPCRKLRAAMTTIGLDGKDLVDAAHTAFPEFRKTLGGDIKVSRPFKRKSFASDPLFLDALAALVAQPGSAVIINMSTPSYRHWTVVNAIGPSKIELRNSSTLTALPRDRYTIKRGRYRISPHETLLVVLTTGNPVPRKGPAP
jgi:hypothetical protein